MLLLHQSNLFPITRLSLTSTAHLKRHENLSVNQSSTLFRNPVTIIKIPIKNYPLLLTRCSSTSSSSHSSTQKPTTFTSDDDTQPVKDEVQEKSFWGAVSLIIGAAVGPGMLGLPSATIKSGQLPSSIAILLSWVYVVSSILLVAELSFAAMEEDGIGEVSFTALARNELGGMFGAIAAVVYAGLCFSLLVACVSGIGSIVTQWFPWMSPLLAHALFPFIFGAVIRFFPFKAIDAANRFLCFIMIFSITALVATGLSVGRTSLLGSWAYASWSPFTIVPAIPIIVLTLGFHVITPFVCKIVGKSVFDARKAILVGGAVPLLMVLSWNFVVLGLAETNTASLKNPISFLLSVNSSALPAVQGFVFTALATSLIGYAISFPKQLVDTVELLFGRTNSKQHKYSSAGSNEGGTGRVGSVVFLRGNTTGTCGQVSFIGSKLISGLEATQKSSTVGFSSVTNSVMLFTLVGSVLIASFFPSAFSKALDFAGVYANCFLFGILPPVMSWIHRSRKKFRSINSEDGIILPGGDTALLLLFGIAVILGVWH